MIFTSRYAIADFVRACAASSRPRERGHRDALLRFAAHLEALTDRDPRPDRLIAIAGGGERYAPNATVRNAVVRSVRPGVDPQAVLEQLIVFATADSLARLRDRYVRGEISP